MWPFECVLSAPSPLPHPHPPTYYLLPLTVVYVPPCRSYILSVSFLNTEPQRIFTTTYELNEVKSETFIQVSLLTSFNGPHTNLKKNIGQFAFLLPILRGGSYRLLISLVYIE